MSAKIQTATETISNGAEGVTWDLSDLYLGTDDPQIERDTEESLQRAEAFEEKFRGTINSQTLSDLHLLEGLQELEAIQETLGKILSYAHLIFAADTANPKSGAFLQRVQQDLTKVRKHFFFFELELLELPEETAEDVFNRPSLNHYKHFLETVRAYKPYRLSEAEEKLNDERLNTGSRAFSRLFDEVINHIDFNVRLDGKMVSMTESEALALLYDPSRSKRKAAAKGVTKALEGSSHILTYIFNTLVQDHAVTDRLRSFEHPMASRNLSNEISKETVYALLDSTEANNDMVRRYYRLKKKLLGLAKLYDYDRYAPIFPDSSLITYDVAKAMVLESFDGFSPEMSRIAGEFFSKNWIDAELRAGKRGGAFSHGTVPSVHPYVFTNYTGRLRDVMILAHELGHGVHQYLSRRNGYFQCHTPLTTAETASVFAEMLVFGKLKESEGDPKKRLSLICSKLEDIFATVFRQVVMTRFEQTLHRARRDEGELTQERVSELWMKANERMFGKSVKLTDDYRIWWMYIPHFIHSPFYCYAYAFGELLVLALYKKYLDEGKQFVPHYLNLLSAGGSDKPDALLNHIGVDINDGDFWQGGLDLIRDMVTEAEGLAPQNG